MSLRKINSQQFQLLYEAATRSRAELIGYTPGEAAAELGISRQAVHKAIHRGDLEAFVAELDSGGTTPFMITAESLREFARRRAERDG